MFKQEGPSAKKAVKDLKAVIKPTHLGVSYSAARKINKTITMSGDVVMVLHNILVESMMNPGILGKILEGTQGDGVPIEELVGGCSAVLVDLLDQLEVDVPAGSSKTLGEIYGFDKEKKA